MSKLLPEQYKWLAEEGAPKMLTEGLKLLGIKEIPGAQSNKAIMAMAKDLGLEKIYLNDDVAWCALAHSFIAKRAGKELPGKSYELLRAKSYLNFGHPVEVAMLGDTLVFERDGGFHVCLYAGESPTAYLCLGGNQSNSYCLTWIAKDRCVGKRRPSYSNQPANIRQIHLSKTGELSKNEA